MLAGANSQLIFQALQSLTEGVFRLNRVDWEMEFYSVPGGFELTLTYRE